MSFSWDNVWENPPRLSLWHPVIQAKVAMLTFVAAANQGWGKSPLVFL